MTAEKPTFQVVVVALERADIINRFVTYHLAIGAQRVLVYHDGPLDQHLRHGDGIEHVEMNGDFWKALGVERPADCIDRQRAVYNRAARSGCTDWTLIIDIDEFLVAPTPLREMLARIPATDAAIRIPNEEAVWGPGDRFGQTLAASWFRTAMQPGRARRLMRVLHGSDGDLLRKGVTAYSHGKHMIRNDAVDLDIGMHRSVRDGKKYGVWLHKACPGIPHTFIAHFDAIDFDQWEEKWRRRRGTDWERRNLSTARHSIMKSAITKAFDTPDNGRAAWKLFATLHCATRWQAIWLRLFGQLKKRRIFADPAKGTPYHGD